jgi:hypothetical protein
MKKLILTVGLAINVCQIFGMTMYTEEQARENAMVLQEFVRNLHSPTYLESFMKRRGTPANEIPQKIQNFYEKLKKNKTNRGND